VSASVAADSADTFTSRTHSRRPPQIEEARRREQADKIAAINALERQSQEIMRHKQAMAALQTRISSMQSQLLVGGQKVEDTPQFRRAPLACPPFPRNMPVHRRARACPY
jgi:hypothetical protein